MVKINSLRYTLQLVQILYKCGLKNVFFKLDLNSSSESLRRRQSCTHYLVSSLKSHVDHNCILSMKHSTKLIHVYCSKK